MTFAKDDKKGRQPRRVKDLIIADPGLVLDDVEVLQALAAVRNDRLGENVIDGRGMAISRLEQELKQLQEENKLLKEVLHENSDAVHRIHLAALSLLETDDTSRLGDFIDGELPKVLKVEKVRLLLDSSVDGGIPELLTRIATGPIDASVRRGYLDPVKGTPERVILRQISKTPTQVYGEAGPPIRSEALLPIAVDGLGLIGVLVVGSSRSESFRPHMSTELLELIGKVFAMTVARLPT